MMLFPFLSVLRAKLGRRTGGHVRDDNAQERQRCRTPRRDSGLGGSAMVENRGGLQCFCSVLPSMKVFFVQCRIPVCWRLRCLGCQMPPCCTTTPWLTITRTASARPVKSIIVSACERTLGSRAGQTGVACKVICPLVQHHTHREFRR